MTCSRTRRLKFVATGWPYGDFSYAMGLEPLLFNLVPLALPLFWVPMLVNAWLLAVWLKTQLHSRLPGGGVVTWALAVLLLVVFDLEAEPVVSDESVDVDRKSHLIEDIGEVRHVKHTKKGVSMAVELYGLKDADVDELIRAANVASIKSNEQKHAINEKHSQVKRQEVAV